jgi:hypothetical protein
VTSLPNHIGFYLLAGEDESDDNAEPRVSATRVVGNVRTYDERPAKVDARRGPELSLAVSFA